MPRRPFWKIIAGQVAGAGWACGFVTYSVHTKRMWAIDATRGQLHILIHSDDLPAGFLELKAQCKALENRKNIGPR